MSRKTELELKMAAIRRELDKIESAEITIRNKALAGKHFKYDNSYGSGSRWYLYRKVISVKGPNVYTFDFQTTSLGEMQCQPKHAFYRHMHSGHVEISKREWDREFKKFRERFAAASPR